MATQHAALTGANLHEPKGVAAASADTVYIADGAASGAWTKLGSGSIDTSEIFNTNKVSLSVNFPDIGTAGSIYVPVPWASSLTKATTSVWAAAGTANTVLTFFVEAGSVMDGTVTIAVTATAGEVDSGTMTTNNVFTAGQFLKITTDGGTSGTVPCQITLDFTRTG